ncbi:actin [Entamoeba marina]
MRSSHPPVIIDIGASTVKSAFSDKMKVNSIFTNVVGKPRIRGCFMPGIANTFYIGEDAILKRGVLDIKRPIENGIITDWNDMEKIFHHTIYNEIRVPPEEQPLLLTYPNKSRRSDKERLSQLMFEVFSIPSFCLKLQEELSLYCTGKTTGTVVQCGDSGCLVVPVIDGNTLLHYGEYIDINGNDLDDYFRSSLLKKGFDLCTLKDKEILRQIREKFCYFSTNYLNEIQHIQHISYELPDGSLIDIGKELIECPEALFNPYILNLNEIGIHQTTLNIISKCDSCYSNELHSNILLCGGNSMYNKMDERFENEIFDLSNKRVHTLKLPNSIEKIYSTIIGGSLLSSLSSFDTMCISKDIYDEYGPYMAVVWGF